MGVAVLAELQRLLGPTTFRPGGVAPLVAKLLRQDPHGLMASAGDHSNPALLVLSSSNGKLEADVLYRAAFEHVPTTALTVNLTMLAHTVRRALDHAD